MHDVEHLLRLLAAVERDLHQAAHDPVDRLDLVAGAAHRAAGAIGHHAALLDLGGRHLDDGADLGRRILAALRQRAHLLRHHRETAAGAAGPRRLDRGIERQQLGLEGHRLHQPDDVDDLAALDLQRLHALAQALHRLAAALGFGAHRAHMLGRIVDLVRARIHRAGEALRPLDHLGQRIAHLAGAPRQTGVADRHLARGMGHRGHTVLDRLEQRRDAGVRPAQRVERMADLVAPPATRTCAQIALADAVEMTAQRVQPARHHPVQADQQIEADQRQHAQQRQPHAEPIDQHRLPRLHARADALQRHVLQPGAGLDGGHRQPGIGRGIHRGPVLCCQPQGHGQQIADRSQIALHRIHIQ